MQRYNCLAKEKRRVSRTGKEGPRPVPRPNRWWGETRGYVIASKLETKEGSLPCPATLHSDWTTDFSNFPNFTYGDIYAYLINKEGYDHESLKAYKSFEGYRLFLDGHVLKLMYNKNSFDGYHFVSFGVKPTEREKTQIGQRPTYDGWMDNL